MTSSVNLTLEFVSNVVRNGSAYLVTFFHKEVKEKIHIQTSKQLQHKNQPPEFEKEQITIKLRVLNTLI